MSEDTSTLTGTQKVAVVLMNMSHERAAQVMREFSEAEAEEIAAEIVRLRRVDSQAAEAALVEFHGLTVKGGWQARGGRDFATGLLEASFGSDRAAGVMSRVASSLAGRAFEFLDGTDPQQLLAMIDGELPQTIALVLAHLRPDQASAVLSGLGEARGTDVAQCIATMGSATPEATAIVADALKVRVGAVVAPQDAHGSVGGVQPLVEIINRADAFTERALLEGLELRDPALANEVRSRMLTFADIVKFEARDVQQVLRGIDAGVLAKAMKGSSPAVMETIRDNLSERNRQLLDEEIEALGPVRLSEVEEARAEIVHSIRELEALGAITVQRPEEDQYVE